MSRVIFPLVISLAMAACAGTTATPPASQAAVEPEMPACAGAGPQVPSPTELPADLPLPPGTRLTSVTTTAGGEVVIGGVVPSTLADAAQFFVRELPAAGFEIGEGDAELDEAEAEFNGAGRSGRWKVHSILDCPGAVNLTIALAGTQGGGSSD